MTAAGVALLEPEELDLGLDALDESHGGQLCVCVCVGLCVGMKAIMRFGESLSEVFGVVSATSGNGEKTVMY
jgi:hypothetical protein